MGAASGDRHVPLGSARGEKVSPPRVFWEVCVPRRSVLSFAGSLAEVF